MVASPCTSSTLCLLLLLLHITCPVTVSACVNFFPAEHYSLGPDVQPTKDSDKVIIRIWDKEGEPTKTYASMNYINGVLGPYFDFDGYISGLGQRKEI